MLCKLGDVIAEEEYKNEMPVLGAHGRYGDSLLGRKSMERCVRGTSKDWSPDPYSQPLSSRQCKAHPPTSAHTHTHKEIKSASEKEKDHQKKRGETTPAKEQRRLSFFIETI